MFRTLHTGWLVARNCSTNVLLHRYATDCDWLWDSVFIDPCGRVYSCCHAKPLPLGNIYRRDLGVIWSESRRLRVCRWMSRRRCLPCFYHCNIVGERSDGTLPCAPVPIGYPNRIWILCGERCNVNCIMCWQDHRSTKVIDTAILLKRVDWSRVEEIELQGGEVLAMRNGRELYLELTRGLNKKVNLLTNGVLIDDEWAEHLVRGSRFIAVSVNAATKETHERVNRGSSFDRVVGNLRKMIALNQQLGTGARIIYQFTIVPENAFEIAQAIDLACSIGCDKITYSYDVSVPHYLARHEDLKQRIRAEVAQETERCARIEVQHRRLEELGLLESSLLAAG